MYINCCPRSEKYIYWLLALTNEQGSVDPLNTQLFHTKKQHTVLQWPLKMNTAPATAQAHDLKGHMWTLQWKQKSRNQGWYLRRKFSDVLYFSIPQPYSKF